LKRIVTLTLAAALLAAPAAAQNRRAAAATRRAAETITEADLRRWVFALADDSMLGRATPSPQLEMAARYIADEFRRMGLEPGGDSGSYFQRYPILRTGVDSGSFAMVMGRGAHGHWAFGREVRLANGPVPAAPISGNVVLVHGMPADSARPFGDVSVRGAVVLHVTTVAAAARGIGRFVQRAQDDGAAAYIIVSDRPAVPFQGNAAAQLRPRFSLGGVPEGRGLTVLEVRDSSALGVLTAAGEDLAALRAGTGVRALTGFTAQIDLRRREYGRETAPNVIGVLRGSDPALSNEYIVFSGHMDHVGAVGPGRTNGGCAARGADSICNGADDDASGTAMVMALAQAMSRMNPRPRRSMIFMAVSGEERGLWGSEYYSEHPTFPLENTVANFNTDMVGRYYNNQPGWRDTIVVIGKEHSDLGATANRIVAEHPELRMNLIDDLWPQENFYFRSDHFNFARKGVPILFFFNGVHPDYHQVSDSPDKIDTEKMVRIGRMLFYLGLEVANATPRPQWNPQSRSRIVEPATP
jgi:hypothetical protein